MLSILIPTVPDRKKVFNALVEEVNRQILSNGLVGVVDIIFDDSKKFLDGGITVGEKRDNLVQRVIKKYCCFLDDDENISPTYVKTLYSMCLKDVDVCTFRSLYKCDHYWALVDMDMENPINEQATELKIVKRRAWHICPIRTSIAQRHRFSHINNAEDWDWMERVLIDVVTHCHTDEIIHQYNHSASASLVDEIERNK